MTIEVERQVVREGFDVLELSGGDINKPRIVQLTGIDPAASGAPDIRIIGENDVAVLSAVALRCNGESGPFVDQAATVVEEATCRLGRRTPAVSGVLAV